MLHLIYSGEVRRVDLATGRVTRMRDGAVFHEGSNAWRITGAVRFNNFGVVVESVGLDTYAAMVAREPAGLRFKNGKPRWYLTDIDHGTQRIQMNAPLCARVTGV